jgi:hypothetical protein
MIPVKYYKEKEEKIKRESFELKEFVIKIKEQRYLLKPGSKSKEMILYFGFKEKQGEGYLNKIIR